MESLRDFIQPQLGDDTVRLPVTFDYNGGRSESNKTRRVLSWMFGVIGFLLGLLILFSKGDRSFFVKFIIVSVLYAALIYGIRFLLLREGRLRKQYYEQLDNDYKLLTDEVWGIYDIDGEELKVAHYRNGKIGIAFGLEKDVIVGLDSKAEFNHYESIADAYNECAKHKVALYHIDYMAHVGKDKRINTLYAQAGKSPNPDMRAVLNGMYSHLEEDMVHEISTFDTYFLIMPATEVQAVAIAQRIIEKFLEGNYVGYYSLDEEGLRSITAELFNLNSFSVVDAQRSALVSTTSSIAVPITLERRGVVTKLNKTVAERRQEAEEQRELQKFIKQEKQRRLKEQRNNRKKNKNKNKKVEESDEEIIEL